MMADLLSLQEVLKPFYQRASDAQDRLARLEAVVPDKTNKKEESGESLNLLPLEMMEDRKNLEEILKILSERASEAEDRVEKLEAAVPAMKKKKEKSGGSLNLLPLGMTEGGKNLGETLTILNERASEAEDRVEKLEAVVTAVRSSEDGNVLKALKQKELQDLKAANDAEMEQVQKAIDVLRARNDAEMEEVQRDRQNLTVERRKLFYRITHLIRALQESDSQLMSVSCTMVS